MLNNRFGKSDYITTGHSTISLRTHNYRYSTEIKLLTGTKEVNYQLLFRLATMHCISSHSEPKLENEFLISSN